MHLCTGKKRLVIGDVLPKGLAHEGYKRGIKGRRDSMGGGYKRGMGCTRMMSPLPYMPLPLPLPLPALKKSKNSREGKERREERS